MRFRFIEQEKANFSICRMCKVLRVSESGYYAWVSRPASQRQRDDMVFLAHIRAVHKRNYCAYGRKRMTDELRDQGIVIGERRVGRLMQDNDIRTIRTREFKRTTNSDHKHNIAPNLLDGDFQARGQIKNGQEISVISGRRKAGYTSRSSSICSPACHWLGR